MIKFLLIFPIFLFAKVIKFSPLPIDTENNLYHQYEAMLNSLHQKTGDTYKFVYSSSYTKLLQNFKNGKVDMIILGALPYLRLKSQFKYAKPIVTFLNKTKKPYYTCQIISNDKEIKSLDDIKKDTHIILTNKLSTCGYLMTQYMFKKQNKNLDDYKYEYVGSHVDVVFYTTLFNNSIGDVKSSIAKTYSYFVHTIDTSIHIPSFSMIVNTKTISKNKIKKITKALSTIDFKGSKKYSKTIRNGVIITPDNFYNSIEKISKQIKVK